MQLVNHSIPHTLLDRVQELFKEHYKNSMEEQFQKSSVVRMLESALSQGMNFTSTKIDADWETGFFLQHKTNTATPHLPASFKYNNLIAPCVFIIRIMNLLMHRYF